MPRSLKGSFSSLRAVWRVMFGSLGALPKRAYLVLSTFISSPDISWNCFMILSISCSWGMALGDWMNRLMSSAYASMRLEVPCFDFQG